MAESVALFLEKYLSPEVIVFIVSMTPILELRGGLIVAKLLGVPLAVAWPLAVVANMIPVPFIIFFIERILRFLQKHGPIKKFATSIETKGRKLGAEMEEKYSKKLSLGLFLFVAIPLPGTGAWTGALIAALLGLKPRRSAPPICLGVLGASIIMVTLTYLVPGIFGF